MCLVRLNARWNFAATLLAMCTLFVASLWAGQVGVRAQTLEIAGDGFTKKTREDISGAVCPASNTRWCYAVNDEKKYLQMFKIEGMVLTVLLEKKTSPKDPPEGMRIRLAEKSEFHKGDELDTEAVTYADGFVYVAGSHSVKRKTGEVQQSRNLLFRFQVNPETGQPLFDPTSDAVDDQIERSVRLNALLSQHGILAPFLGKSPRENGLNIEGMAVRGDTAVFGFRQPSLWQEVGILSVDLACLFADDECRPVFVGLPMEVANLGIRDIALHEGRFILLVGTAVGEENAVGQLFSWGGGLDAPIKLTQFDLHPGEKPEGLLIVPEAAGGARTIVFFDGIENGGPRQIPVDY